VAGKCQIGQIGILKLKIHGIGVVWPKKRLAASDLPSVRLLSVKKRSRFLYVFPGLPSKLNC
jgi:hypothetical protein